MNLEKWLKKYDIKEITKRHFNDYIYQFKKNRIEDYNNIFRYKNESDIKLIFSSVQYVIGLKEKDLEFKNKYILSVLRLSYDGEEFAEYKIRLDVNANLINEKFKLL